MACLVDIPKLVEELHLIRCSLLPTETLHFIDHDDQVNAQSWTRILDEYGTSMTIPNLFASRTVPPPSFQVWFNSPGSLAKVWLEVEMSKSGPGKPAMASFKGGVFTRADQERWQELRLQKEREVAGADYPTYELLSTHLLPLLHEHFESDTDVNDQEQQSNDDTEGASTGEPHHIYHTLLTSHHLVSMTKRRSLQGWSSSLSISGFAKVGYPGVIYAEGKQDDVEEFVANVKAMQWLALRVRFVEPLLEEPEGIGRGEEKEKGRRKGWKEFQKVGEVVQEMKDLGRERYVVTMGIGSGSGKSN